MTRCYPFVCEAREHLEQWIARWSDLVPFEDLPAITAAEAVARIAPRR